MAKLAALPLSPVTLALLSFQSAIIVAVFGSPVDITNSTDSVSISTHCRAGRNTLSARLPDPPPFPIHEDWKDWETWEPSADVVKAFPYTQMGYDLNGLAVYYIDFGKWDYRAWAKQSEEKVVEFWKYFEQLVRREQKDAARCNGMIEIVDFDGFNLKNHASQKAIKLALTMFAGKIRVDSFMSYGYFVNVNFSAEMFINSARPFLSDYIEKFEWYGTRLEKWKPLLLRKISMDQLIPKLGGSPDWKPAPFNP